MVTYIVRGYKNICMATKEELAKEANEILGTDMEFQRMKLSDLELFVELLDEGALIEPQVKHTVAKHGKKRVEEQVDNWYPGKYATRVL